MLEDKIYSTNNLFRELFRKAQYTDGRYARQMREITARIDAYIRRMDAIRDSFDPVSGVFDIGVLERFYAENKGSRFGYMGKIVPSTASDKLALTARAVNSGLLSFVSNSAVLDFPWGLVEDLTQVPLATLQDIDFASLATMFTQLIHYSDLEKFINLLADPVVGTANHRVTVFSPNSGQTAFIFCDYGIGRIREHITRDINGMLVAQIFLGPGEAFDELQAGRRNIMTHAALLSEVMHLTRPTEGVGAFPLPTRFVAISDNDRPITLTKSTPDSTHGFTLTSQIATMSENRSLGVTESFVGGHIFDEEVHISQLLYDEGISNRVINATEAHYVLLHEFDMAGYIVRSIIKNITGIASGLVFIEADKVVSITKDVIKGITGTATSVPSAQADAMRIQGQFRDAADKARLGNYLRIFGMDAIVVSRVGHGLQMYAWASPDTPASLAAFNQVTNSNSQVPSTNYSFIDLMDDSKSVFDSFRGLATSFDGDTEISRLGRMATTNQALHPATFVPELQQRNRPTDNPTAEIAP